MKEKVGVLISWQIYTPLIWHDFPPFFIMRCSILSCRNYCMKMHVYYLRDRINEHPIPTARLRDEHDHIWDVICCYMLLPVLTRFFSAPSRSNCNPEFCVTPFPVSFTPSRHQ